jgi:hypothetical protein
MTTMFALSSKIAAGEHVVLDLSVLYEPIQGVTNAFRSSGRLVWPLYYAVFAAAVMAAARRRVAIARGLLLGALALQLIDARHVDGRPVFSLGNAPPPSSAVWDLARGDYDRLYIDPPDIQGGFTKCSEIKNTPGSFVPLARVAIREHLVFNSGITSRFDEAATLAACEEMTRNRLAETFDPRTIYAPEPHVMDSYLHAPSMTCGRLDGRAVCVRKDRLTPLARLLSNGGETQDPG